MIIKQNHYSTLRRMILAAMTLLPFIPFIIVIGIGYYYFVSSLERNSLTSMERIVADHGHIIDVFLNERVADLDFLMNTNSYEYLSNSENLRIVFDNLQKETSAFTDLGVFNEDGLHVAYCGVYRLKGKSYRDADWFTEVMKNGKYISDVFLGYRQEPHFIIALKGNDNGKPWVVRATIDTYFFNHLVEKVRIGKTGEAYILNTAGIFQTQRRSGGDLMETDPDHIMFPEPGKGVAALIRENAEGEKYVYVFTWLKNKNWLLVARQEQADAFKDFHTAAYLIILISIIGGGTIIFIAVFLTDRIVDRMKTIDAEKDRLEQQLIGASRLAELGEMAAGFAHEINNPLQIMKSEKTLIELIISELAENNHFEGSDEYAQLMDSVNQLQVQIDRCGIITQSILKFGRQSEPVYQDIDLTRFVPEITSLIRKKANVQGIDVQLSIGKSLSNVHGDPAQLQQVLLNLYNNAIDAVTERHGTGGGEISVKVCPVEKNAIKISVSDNGNGISKENLQKVFSPFFTTKPVGKGTGLGLSVCYGIIDHMGGVMEVESEKGVGTTFTVTLPASKENTKSLMHNRRKDEH